MNLIDDTRTEFGLLLMRPFLVTNIHVSHLVPLFKKHSVTSLVFLNWNLTAPLKIVGPFWGPSKKEMQKEHSAYTPFSLLAPSAPPLSSSLLEKAMIEDNYEDKIDRMINRTIRRSFKMGENSCSCQNGVTVRELHVLLFPILHTQNKQKKLITVFSPCANLLCNFEFG